jgi:hypothetical protein
MSVDYSRAEEEYAPKPPVDRLLAYFGRLFRDEPVGASIAAGFILGGLAGSAIVLFLAAVAAYALTEPLRRETRTRPDA